MNFKDLYMKFTNLFEHDKESKLDQINRIFDEIKVLLVRCIENIPLGNSVELNNYIVIFKRLCNIDVNTKNITNIKEYTSHLQKIENELVQIRKELQTKLKY